MPPRRSDVRPPPKAGNPGAPAPKAVEPKGPPATKPKVGPPPAPVPKQPTIAAGTSRLAGVQAIVQGQSAQEFVFGAQVEPSTIITMDDCRFVLFNLGRDCSSPGETHPTGKPPSILCVANGALRGYAQ